MDPAHEPDPSLVRRSRSFGDVAEAYDRYRPGPPAEAVEWLLQGVTGTAVDLGAGTGSLARAMAASLQRVVACEPDGRMRAVLRRRSPDVAVIGAVGESLPLADRSVDAVAVSSAWHWMDPRRAVPEVARVLRPGGVFGAVWTGPDRRIDWVEAALGAWRLPGGSPVPGPGRLPSEEQGPRSVGGSGPGGRRTVPERRHVLSLPAGAPFDEPERHEVSVSVSVTAEELVGLAATYSRMIVLPETERARSLNQVRDFAESLGVPGSDRIELPLHSRCWRSRRR